MSNNFEIYKSVHKALRVFLFQVSSELGKYDVDSGADLQPLKEKFEELSVFLKDHASHEDNFFGDIIERTEPEIFANLEAQHKQSENEWQTVEEQALEIFNNMPTAAQFHRFYLAFNKFIAGYLAHIHFEETVALPIIWKGASEEEMMRRFQAMFKVFTPKTHVRSKTWCLQGCNQTELRELNYV